MDKQVEQKKLSIVIGTYNKFGLLQQRLDSLIGKVRVTHEIVVIGASSIAFTSAP
jgi:hypothetical protein